jgi:GTP:adenosylcobinamide-phosphate guanylyltransferase
MDKINAVILAGGTKRDAVWNGVDNKAFLDVNGRWMVEYVVEALKMSEYIGEIAVVGPVEQLRSRLNEIIDHYLEDRGSLFDNINEGVTPFMRDEGVIMITSDIPMIDGYIVDDFIRRCGEKEGADLYYPIVEKHVNEFKYPGFERTYVKLKEGTFTGGNVVFINPRVVGPCEEAARKAISHRKSPWKICHMLGPKFLAMLLMGTLSIRMVEERLSQILQLRGTAVITPYPELANDVDKPTDLHAVIKHLSKKQV